MDSKGWGDTAIEAGLALVPLAGGALSVVAARVLEDRRAGARRAGEVALSVVGDPDKLVASVRADERLAALLVNAAEAASRTVLEDKRRMLGVVIGRAVLDPARIDESELAQAALQDLDATHLHCLEALLRARADAIASGVQGEDVNDVVLEAGEAYPTPVLSMLIRHGCVHPASHWGGGTSVYDITAFGEYLLDDVLSAARHVELKDHSASSGVDNRT